MSQKKDSIQSDNGSPSGVGLSVSGWILFGIGFFSTAVALASGFIWAYQGRMEPVFVAAFVAWVGYVVAHYGATGLFIDGNGHTESHRSSRCVETDGLFPTERWRQGGIFLGVATLVTGMVLGVIFIRQEHYLFTSVGGILFFGGYVIAHYAETDLLL